MKRSALFLLLISSAALAQERLTPGPGSALTENKCKICHELQHIRRQPLSRGEWADNLRNMKERGAPITDAELQVILDYLSTYYNREKPAPAAAADSPASAEPMEQLLSAKGCVGCHALDARVVGPSFREIAKRYAGDAGAATRLAQKVRAGGQGAWGQVPMPPNDWVSDGEAKTLVDWVLTQK